MTDISTTTATSCFPTSSAPPDQSVQQLPPGVEPDAVDGVGAPDGTVIVEPPPTGGAGALSPAWADRLGSVLWQLGYPPETIALQLEAAGAANLTEQDLATAYATLTRELALSSGSPAWQQGVEMGGVGQGPGPGQYPGQGGPPGGPPTVPYPPQTGGPTKPPVPTYPPPQQGGGVPTKPPTPSFPPHPGDPGTRPPATPYPPDGGPGPKPGPGPTPGPGPKPDPGQEPDPGQGPDPKPDPGNGGGSLAPWLIGLGILGAGAAGVVAFRGGAHNVRALRATAAAWNSGEMSQGGLQAIKDAQQSARFTAGIGLGDYMAVALPGVNRLGSNRQLVSAARGHLGSIEMLASMSALQDGVGASVRVDPALRRNVLAGLESGRSLPKVLDGLDRGSPHFADERALIRHWDRASVLTPDGVPRDAQVQAAGLASDHVVGGARFERPELRLDQIDGTDRRQLVETGGTAKINRIVATHRAKLGDQGLADGVGTAQAINVGTLPKALQEQAIAQSGIDPATVDRIGLDGAYMDRWRFRLSPDAANSQAVPPTAPNPAPAPAAAPDPAPTPGEPPIAAAPATGRRRDPDGGTAQDPNHIRLGPVDPDNYGRHAARVPLAFDPDAPAGPTVAPPLD